MRPVEDSGDAGKGRSVRQNDPLARREARKLQTPTSRNRERLIKRLIKTSIKWAMNSGRTVIPAGIPYAWL